MFNLFNFWKPFPKHKPKKNGWYICSIRYGDEPDQAYVMDLYWYGEVQQWRDNRALNVFTDYYVYDENGIRISREDILSRKSLCVRTDVIAFKKVPKKYR